MIPTQKATALLDVVKAAREQRRTIAGRVHQASLEDAYWVQTTLAQGREVSGYKLGLISPAKQEQMGIATPIYGRVFPEMILESPISLSRFIQPKCEPELALMLHEDLTPGAAPRKETMAAYLAVDFLDSIWQDYKFNIAEVVADNSSGGGFLIGDEPLSDPFNGRLRMSFDGEVVAEGPLEILRNWEERLAWLAGEVGGLRTGQVIFLGSPAAAVEPRPGLLELRGPGNHRLVAQIQP